MNEHYENVYVTQELLNDRICALCTSNNAWFGQRNNSCPHYLEGCCVCSAIKDLLIDKLCAGRIMDAVILFPKLAWLLLSIEVA